MQRLQLPLTHPLSNFASTLAQSRQEGRVFRPIVQQQTLLAPEPSNIMYTLLAGLLFSFFASMGFGTNSENQNGFSVPENPINSLTNSSNETVNTAATFNEAVSLSSDDNPSVDLVSSIEEETAAESNLVEFTPPLQSNSPSLPSDSDLYEEALDNFLQNPGALHEDGIRLKAVPNHYDWDDRGNRWRGPGERFDGGQYASWMHFHGIEGDPDGSLDNASVDVEMATYVLRESGEWERLETPIDTAIYYDVTHNEQNRPNNDGFVTQENRFHSNLSHIDDYMLHPFQQRIETEGILAIVDTAQVTLNSEDTTDRVSFGIGGDYWLTNAGNLNGTANGDGRVNLEAHLGSSLIVNAGETRFAAGGVALSEDGDLNQIIAQYGYPPLS